MGEFIPLFDLLAGDHTAPRGTPPASSPSPRPVTRSAGDRSAAPWRVSAQVPEDWLWLPTVTLLADACIHLGDRQRRRRALPPVVARTATTP